jgi:hypothetical protein
MADALEGLSLQLVSSVMLRVLSLAGRLVVPCRVSKTPRRLLGARSLRPHDLHERFGAARCNAAAGCAIVGDGWWHAILRRGAKPPVNAAGSLHSLSHSGHPLYLEQACAAWAGRIGRVQRVHQLFSMWQSMCSVRYFLSATILCPDLVIRESYLAVCHTGTPGLRSAKHRHSDGIQLGTLTPRVRIAPTSTGFASPATQTSVSEVGTGSL